MVLLASDSDHTCRHLMLKCGFDNCILPHALGLATLHVNGTKNYKIPTNCSLRNDAFSTEKEKHRMVG
jgi:hypothetical protein